MIQTPSQSDKECQNNKPNRLFAMSWYMPFFTQWGTPMTMMKNLWKGLPNFYISTSEAPLDAETEGSKEDKPKSSTNKKQRKVD